MILTCRTVETLGPAALPHLPRLTPFATPAIVSKCLERPQLEKPGLITNCPPSPPHGTPGLYGCQKLNKDECKGILQDARSCEECVCGTDL